MIELSATSRGVAFIVKGYPRFVARETRTPRLRSETGVPPHVLCRATRLTVLLIHQACLPDSRILQETTVTMPKVPGVIALFDVDGTLTVPRNKIDDEMRQFMRDLRQHVTVGIVGEGRTACQSSRAAASARIDISEDVVATSCCMQF